MKMSHNFALSAVVLAMGFHAQAQEANSETKIDQDTVEKVIVVGTRTEQASKGATGLTMELNETPQSISVITSELLKNYGANSLNDALKLATGVTVEEYETNRTNYTSRGFDIKSTQVDGVGMPNNWGIVTGAMESYGYDEIEVIRGANGLLTGVGNAAGTINYVRKRPTNENQGEVGITLGSFDLKRLQADYSALLTDNGSWAARVVAVIEDKESYLDGLTDDRTYLYGVVDGQLTENSTLAAGFSYQKANTDGNMWGGLVFNYTDGTQAEFHTGASPTQEWTSWNTENTSAFIEYAYTFTNDWEAKVTYNNRTSEDPSKLFYVYGAIDKATGLGLNSYPGRYEDEFNADLLDINLIGDFSLFGKEHQLNLGMSSSSSSRSSHNYAALTGWDPAPAFPYALDAIPEPTWGERTLYADIDITLNRYFGSTKFNVSDSFFVVAGFNAIDFTREGINSGVLIDNEESELSPYIGATYSINDDINLYVSYSDIYQPQEQYDFDGYFLAPTKGVNFEAGIKTQWFNDDLLATFAVFSAEQDNLANYAGINANGNYYYTGINVQSTGFELELVGKITDNLTTTFGYTSIDIENDAGDKTNEWAPRNVINYTFNYTVPQVQQLTVGLGGKWQSDIINTTYNVKQDAYLLVNAFARYDISDKLNVQANLNNLTDEKYINTLYNVGYYGAPVNGSVSLSYSF
ncbi:TonB-dependent siderophore receptor [Psychrosphaera sp. F3M07]|uniref:TonB-dependent siderophore receptor n=1 Tax=Psychrosphaera sp. F3M07 TaxID=2841560 RepID=UPI001C08D269|nr:TonB-dependent siderophore receptor [Psychrosphaera sp. F3M07]MBU2916394.1 TonB-dependent siderophore receptor [Psychrosphaera sp. F3M07]